MPSETGAPVGPVVVPVDRPIWLARVSEGEMHPRSSNAET
jgi:hypothetical protein